jgi:hypothetical protein
MADSPHLMVIYCFSESFLVVSLFQTSAFRPRDEVDIAINIACSGKKDKDGKAMKQTIGV